MASYARCFVLFLLALSFSLQIHAHARDIKFFSKVTKTPKETHDSISLSPAMSPSLAPALSPEPEVVEYGYGLYGRDSYENTPTENSVFEKEDKYIPAEQLLHSKNNGNDNFETGFSNEYQYSPTSENPTKSPFVGDEFSTTNENGNEKKGMSDTRFLENGKYYYDVNQDGKDHEKEKRNEVGNGNGNGYVVDKEGMSETRYKNGYGNGNGNGNEKQGMSDTRFLENGKYYYDVNQESKNKDARNENPVNGYVPEYNGMSDTRFMENGKYFHDIHNQENGKNAMSFNANDNDNHGMSDTRFMENGKYFYDVNENNSNNNNGNENENGNGNGNGGEYYEGSNNEYVPVKRGYQYDGSTLSSNEYVTQGRKGDYGTKKKFPNEYDTMEEYDREQGYLDPQDGYVP